MHRDKPSARLQICERRENMPNVPYENALFWKNIRNGDPETHGSTITTKHFIAIPAQQKYIHVCASGFTCAALHLQESTRAAPQPWSQARTTRFRVIFCIAAKLYQYGKQFLVSEIFKMVLEYAFSRSRLAVHY